MINKLFDKEYTAEADKHIMDMYHCTGPDGRLSVPGFKTGSAETITCKLNWTETEAAISTYAFNNIYKKIKDAAENKEDIKWETLDFKPNGSFLENLHEIIQDLTKLIETQADPEEIEKKKMIFARAYALNQFSDI